MMNELQTLEWIRDTDGSPIDLQENNDGTR